MNRLNLAFLGLGTVAMTLPVSAEKGKNAQSSRPNILLILADDMGYSDIGCFGSEIATPNLDRLAQNGVRFSQFYNAARCCPTRASLLTGLYQHQAGVGDMVNNLGYPSYQGYLNNSSVTLAEALRANGYRTYMSGKWHVGGQPETHPLRRGFDRFFGLIDGAGSYFERKPYRINQSAPRWMLDSTDYNPPAEGFYLTDAIASNAIHFLEEGADHKPFFVYLAFTAPHWPLHALPEDIAKYRGKYLRGWDVLRQERFERMKKLGIIAPSTQLSPRDLNVPAWDSLTTAEQQIWDLRMAVYAAMIDRLDQNVGRVLDYLKKSGKLDNTLVIFLSDNGGCHERIKNTGNYIRTNGETGSPDSFDAIEYPWANVCNTPFRMHKHWVHEGGISTPFIASYPAGIKEGRLNDKTIGHITDIMPTLLDFAGGIYPLVFRGNPVTPMEGISLRKALEGKKMKRTQPVFWEHEGNRAMRLGDWKLVSQYDNRNKKFMDWELYNLRKDRSELNDLSNRYPEIREGMVRDYSHWADRVGVVSREVLDRRGN